MPPARRSPRASATFLLAIAALAAGAQGASPAASVGVIAYPAKGQPAAQQATDETQCYDWAKAQTGYDPKNPPKVEVAAAEPESKGPSGERAKGAVRGAAAGAVIGEVADNDAGKGAAIGATAGVLAGGHRTRKARREEKAKAEEQAKADAQATSASQADTFKRGLSACLESRGYTVK
ncbi:MAG TPA: glycine zipper family protein [Steroidobacteraceae bacterium]|jgi:hypothetical protein|nr:glycine zipper family protein [Steroidobacteraceae bacterium]